MIQQRPDILNYSDFRPYLKDMYLFCKTKNKHFSQRYISDKVQAASAGWFSDIVSGRITLKTVYIPRLVKIMDLSASEKDHFKLLVDCNQASTIEEKNMYFEALLSARTTGEMMVNREQFVFYTTWYYPAIRELLFYYDFKDDYQKLARLLNPPIRPSEAKKAVSVLRNLGFISEDSRGFLKPKDLILKKDTTFRSIHWANFQRAALTLSSEAIDRFSKEERDISSVIVCLSEKSMEKAKEELGKVRKKLLALADADSQRDRVYQCNIQLFPLTGKQIRKEEVL